MIRRFYTSFLFVTFLLLGGLIYAQNAAVELETATGTITPLVVKGGLVTPSNPAAVIYNNGPFVNAPGTGPGGADGSVLQTSLTMTTLGLGHGSPTNVRLADDFTIPAGQTWTIDNALFFAYQTGSTTTSTMTFVNVRIWNGVPGAPGSAVVWGADSTTNRMTATTWANAYRYSETAVGTTRPIMKQTASIGTTLEAGTYWIDWTSNGTIASGPWVPPISILGQTTTGNCMQYQTTTGWAAAVDGGSLTALGLPFILEGTVSTPVNVIFSDGFETYTAGQLLACQAPTLWTTWSNAPCGGEDALVSSDFAYAGTKSVKVITDDDLIKKFGATAYTSGKYKISMYVYIPTGKAGYLNTLATFAGNSSAWALEVYFDATGGGRVNPNGVVPATFQWTPNTWHKVEHFVDLDNNIGMFAFNNNVVHQQQYTLGAYTSAVPKTLDAVDFYGATANDVMYFDNFQIETISVVPVEMTSFAATQAGSKITLNWTTATEVNNRGFEVERKIAESNDWTVIGFKQGFGTTTEAKAYSFVDDISLINANAVSYRLKQIDYDGRYEYSNEILVDNIVPTEFSVAQNYPNPFNPVTSIKYQIPSEKFVTLKVFNSLGEEVRTLVNDIVKAGSHEISFNAEGLSSGVYFYILRAGQDEFVQTMKMILMK
jgi:hypothetical protein